MDEKKILDMIKKSGENVDAPEEIHPEKIKRLLDDFFSSIFLSTFSLSDFFSFDFISLFSLSNILPPLHKYIEKHFFIGRTLSQ